MELQMGRHHDQLLICVGFWFWFVGVFLCFFFLNKDLQLFIWFQQVDYFVIMYYFVVKIEIILYEFFACFAY